VFLCISGAFENTYNAFEWLFGDRKDDVVETHSGTRSQKYLYLVTKYIIFVVSCTRTLTFGVPRVCARPATFEHLSLTFENLFQENKGGLRVGVIINDMCC
jgi:hypothetical protein